MTHSTLQGVMAEAQKQYRRDLLTGLRELFQKAADYKNNRKTAGCWSWRAKMAFRHLRDRGLIPVRTKTARLPRKVFLELAQRLQGKGYKPVNDLVPYSKIAKTVDMPNLLSRGTIRPYTLGSGGQVLPSDLPPGSSSVHGNLKPLPGAKGQTWYANDVSTAASNTEATEGTLTFFRPDQIGQFPDPRSIRPEELRMLTNEVIGRPPVGANPAATFLRQDHTLRPQQDAYVPLSPVNPPSSEAAVPGLDPCQTFATIWGEAKQLGVSPVLYNRVHVLQPQLLQEIKRGTLDVDALVTAIKSQLDSLPGRYTDDGIRRHKLISDSLKHLEAAHKAGNKADQIRYLAQVLLD